MKRQSSFSLNAAMLPAPNCARHSRSKRREAIWYPQSLLPSPFRIQGRCSRRFKSSTNSFNPPCPVAPMADGLVFKMYCFKRSSVSSGMVFRNDTILTRNRRDVSHQIQSDMSRDCQLCSPQFSKPRQLSTTNER